MPGVLKISVALTTEQAQVTYDSSLTGPRSIIDAINNIGFSASLIAPDVHDSSAFDHTHTQQQWKKRFILALVLTVPIFIIMLLPHVRDSGQRSINREQLRAL